MEKIVLEEKSLKTFCHPALFITKMESHIDNIKEANAIKNLVASVCWISESSFVPCPININLIL